MFVFTATLRPFTETDVSSTVSGSFLRGLERDDAIFPNALLPAFNRTLSLDRDVLSEFGLETSAYHGLRAKGANGAYCDCCSGRERSRIQR